MKSNSKYLGLSILILIQFSSILYAFPDYRGGELNDPRRTTKCDLEVQNNLCLFSGDLIVNTHEVDPQLISLISFDKQSLFDESEKKCSVQNVGIHESNGLKGYGRSGRFNSKQSYLKIDQIPTIDNEYSIQFSIYIHAIFKNDVSVFDDIHLPLLLKTHGENIKNLQISLGQDSRKLFLTIVDGELETVKTISSTSRIPLRRWVQVSIVKSVSKVSLYMNGNFETFFTPVISFSFSQEEYPSVKIGNDISSGFPQENADLLPKKTPEEEEDNFIDFLLDDFKIYSRSLESYEIKAKSEPFLGGISSDFYRYACGNCQKSSVSCTQNYHVCTSFEILTEGFQFARTMGWIDPVSPFIWTEEGMLKAQLDSQTGLGMCCKDVKHP